LGTPTTKRFPSKDADPTEITDDGTGSPDNHGADKSITGVDTYLNTCPDDFLVMYPVMQGWFYTSTLKSIFAIRPYNLHLI
jgi:hypothetical protein